MERGVVNGVQNSMNMLLDMLKFVLVIVPPRIEIFDMLIILSFILICIAGIYFATHCYRVKLKKRVCVITTICLITQLMLN